MYRKICDCLIIPNSCLFLVFLISDDEAIECQTAQSGNFPPRYLSSKLEFFVIWALFAVFLSVSLPQKFVTFFSFST